MNNKRTAKAYNRMTADELARATREFDKPLARLEFRPITGRERQRWERAVRGRGRPKVGKGSRPVQITVERALLDRADRLARRIGVSRSELIGSGLRILLAAASRGRVISASSSALR